MAQAIGQLAAATVFIRYSIARPGVIASPDTLLRDNEDCHLLKQNAAIQDDGAKHPCDSSATGACSTHPSAADAPGSPTSGKAKPALSSVPSRPPQPAAVAAALSRPRQSWLAPAHYCVPSQHTMADHNQENKNDL